MTRPLRLCSSPLAVMASLGLTACLASEPPSVDAAPPTTVTVSTVPEASAVAPTADSDGTVMRVYSTPPGRALELAGVLQHVMRTGPDMAPRGRVSALDGDRITVVAPARLHEGIAALCHELAQTTAPARTVTLSYWLVEARPADAVDVSAVPALDEALQRVARHDGAAVFTLADRVQMASLLNASGKTETVRAQYEQTATVQGDAIVADIAIDTRARGGDLRTRVRLTPGQTLVVGQGAWIDDNSSRDPGDDDEPRLYYVVRAELADAA